MPSVGGGPLSSTSGTGRVGLVLPAAAGPEALVVEWRHRRPATVLCPPLVGIHREDLWVGDQLVRSSMILPMHVRPAVPDDLGWRVAAGCRTPSGGPPTHFVRGDQRCHVPCDAGRAAKLRRLIKVVLTEHFGSPMGVVHGEAHDLASLPAFCRHRKRGRARRSAQLSAGRGDLEPTYRNFTCAFFSVVPFAKRRMRGEQICWIRRAMRGRRAANRRRCHASCRLHPARSVWQIDSRHSTDRHAVVL
jgi:hypothetical protein